ncbi:hypothetical protein Rsw2DRAFT_3394, partial [Rhodobacter ferrooxidans]
KVLAVSKARLLKLGNMKAEALRRAGKGSAARRDVVALNLAGFAGG